MKIKKQKLFSVIFIISVSIGIWIPVNADPLPPTTFLGSDWGRHPTSVTVRNEVDDIIGSENTNYEKALTLKNHIFNNWFYNGQIVTESGIDLIAVRPDTETIVNKVTIDGEQVYQGKCYANGILFSSLCRSLGIPARMIMVSFANGIEHLFIEFYTGGPTHNGWITACATPADQGGWFGWYQLQTFLWNNQHWNWDPLKAYNEDSWTIEYIDWVYYAAGESMQSTWIRCNNYIMDDGYYSVRHDEDDGVDSSWNTWDDYKEMFTYWNTIPNTPNRPSGNTVGYVNQLMTFNFLTYDGEGNQIKYEIDWGDGTGATTGYYSSGTKVYMNHRYYSTGTYSVKVRAQDNIAGDERWTSWSSPLSVIIKRLGPF